MHLVLARMSILRKQTWRGACVIFTKLHRIMDTVAELLLQAAQAVQRLQQNDQSSTTAVSAPPVSAAPSFVGEHRRLFTTWGRGQVSGSRNRSGRVAESVAAAATGKSRSLVW